MSRRCHEMQNESEAAIELVNVPNVDAPRPRLHKSIVLKPRSRRFYPASKFCCDDRTSAVFVSVNGDRKERCPLQPHWFKHYIKLIFHVDGGGGLTVKGVEPKLTDYFRFWRRNLRRDYVGRQEFIIIRNSKLSAEALRRYKF